MQARRGSRGIGPLILNLGAECWVFNAAPWSLYSREITAVPIVQGAVWAPVAVWTAVQKRMYLPPPPTGFRTAKLSVNTQSLKLGAMANSVYQPATGWTVRGSNSDGGEVFRTRPDRPWGLPSLL